MIDLYVAFVLPDSLNSNDELHGMLFGTDRLIDGEQIKDDLLKNPGRNSLVHLRRDVGARANSFSKILNNILEQLQKDQRHEVQPLIQTTLLRLKRYKTVRTEKQRAVAWLQ